MKPTVLVILFVIVLLMSACVRMPDGRLVPTWQAHPNFERTPWRPSVTCREGKSWSGGTVTRCY